MAASRSQIRISRKKRETLLAQFDQGGISGAKFAKQAGIKYTTFANWLQKRRGQQHRVMAASKSAPSKRRNLHWLEAVVDGSPKKEPPKLATATLTVHGPNGVRLELSDGKQVKLAAQLLRELGQEQAC